MNRKINKCKIILHSGLIGLLGYLFIGLFLTTASGQTMSNSNYSIQMGNINTAAGESTSSTYKLGITAGQTAPGLYSGTNYKVKSGFQYIHPIVAHFVFTISPTLIDFGTLYPTTPVTRTASLSISKGAAVGYLVIASENHALTETVSNSIIADTTCDNGACSEAVSSLWTNTLTYGFGYRCDNSEGADCSTDFSQSNSYKQFSDDSKGENAQKIMGSANTNGVKKVQISYKINIPGTQTAGNYNNTITYIATPTF